MGCVEEVDGSGYLRIEPAQLEPACAGLGLEHAGARPGRAGVLDVEAGDHQRAIDRLPVRADHPALDGPSRPQDRVDLVRPVIEPGFVGDDPVRVGTRPARLPVGEHLPTDHLQDVVVRRGEDEQVPHAGRNDDLVRAVVRGDDRLLGARLAVRPIHGDVLDRGPGHRPTGPLLGHLAADQDTAREPEVDLLLDRPSGPAEFLPQRTVGLAIGRISIHDEAVAPERFGPESTLAVGLDPDQGDPRDTGAARLDLEHGVRDGPAGIGGKDTSLEGRLEGQGDLPGPGEVFGFEPLVCKPRIRADQVDAEPSADAGDREPALIVRLDRPRPGQQAFDRAFFHRGDIHGDTPRYVHVVDLDLDPGGRPPADVDELAAEDLFGPEPGLGRRPAGIGLEGGPAGAVPRGRGQGMHANEGALGGSLGVDPESAIGADSCPGRGGRSGR